MSDKVTSLEQSVAISEERLKSESFQNDLQNLYTLCCTHVEKKRTESAVISDDLGKFWNYVHVLLISASILCLLLILSGIKVFKLKKKTTELDHLNALFIQGMVDCVIGSDEKGIITHFNKVAVNTFGYTEQEAIGMSVNKLYAHQLAWATVHSELEDNDCFNGEIVNKRKNGTQFTAQLSANTIFDQNGNAIGVMGISRDISLQKRNEEQFQHIVDNATDIIYTTNMSGQITYVNSAATTVLGYAEEEILGTSFQSLIRA